MKINCECGRRIHPARVYPVHCQCGRKHFGEGIPQPRVACIHRTRQIGTADCDCRTKPPIYQCDLLGGLCVNVRPVSGPMLVILTGETKPKAIHVRDCRTCPDRVDP